MGTTLKQYLHEQAAKNQAGKAEVEEWRSAIQRLFSQIREWLNESNPDGVMEIEEAEQVVREPGLGHYRVPRLNLRVLGKWIGIIPKARRTVGTAKPPQKSAPERADGRIDITDEVVRYLLYRFKQDGRDLWMIDAFRDNSNVAWPGQWVATEPQQFDKETFEKVLLSYLK